MAFSPHRAHGIGAFRCAVDNSISDHTIPFRIGRQSPDPLVYNDLMIPDSVGAQISRHHLAFIAHEGRVGVVDRGSSLGSWVDDQKLGGPSAPSGPIFFTGSKGELVLGSRDSPFRYRVSLGAKNESVHV